MVPALETSSPTPSWPRRMLLWGGWCLVMVPLTIVPHELGHLAAARWLGFPNPTLHYSSVDPGDVTGRPVWMQGVVGLAGPAVTLAITVFACVWIALRPRSHGAFALEVSAVSRFAVGTPYTIVNSVVRMLGGHSKPPAFDEHKAALVLGWSGDLVLGITSIVFVVTLVWISRRMPHGGRRVAWAGLLTGTIMGWAIWMLLLGPVLLP